MANKRAVRLNSYGDISHCLKKIVNELRRGEIKAADARAIGYLLNVMLHAMEGKELEKRMDLIEQKLDEKKSDEMEEIAKELLAKYHKRNKSDESD